MICDCSFVAQAFSAILRIAIKCPTCLFRSCAEPRNGTISRRPAWLLDPFQDVRESYLSLQEQTPIMGMDLLLLPALFLPASLVYGLAKCLTQCHDISHDTASILMATFYGE